MGTETLLPGSAIPPHRHLYHDEVLFIHKGQGRAQLEGRSVTVVPGTVIFAPRQSWHSLRNTGTGVLHMSWTAAPAGIEQFFRELSQTGAADAAALQALAQRHGVEFRPEGEPASPAAGARRRHRHRGGRGRRGGSAASHSPAAPKPSPPLVAARPAPQPATPAHAPASAGKPPKPQAKRAGQRRHRGRVKEVYMGGRWVQVTGEGPVIASGKEHPAHPRQPTDPGDQPPTGPLTVAL